MKSRISKSVIKDGLDKKLRMMAAVSTVLENYADVWNNHQGLIRSRSKLVGIMATAQAHVRVKSVATKGVTAVKLEVEKELVSTLLQVQGAMWSLGSETGDARLKAIGEMPRRSIQNLRPIALLEWANQIRIMIQDYGSALESHGLDAILLNALDSQIQSFGVQMPKTGAMINSRVASTSELSVCIASATALLKHSMDKQVMRFELSNPEFFKAYKASRKVHRNAVRSTAQFTEEGSDNVAG